MGQAAHVVLVGIPGSGKSTVGRELARLLQRQFLDLDEQIAALAGASVRELFATRGEASFREMEREATRQLARAVVPMVVAPGGGWIAVPGLVELVRPPSRLIWLQVAPERALQRLGDGVLDRPLLAGDDPLAALTAILTAREPLYLQSDHTISVDMMTPSEVAEAIVALAQPSTRD